ncbi:DMT family transporter [Martelella mediterranea]|uniref:Drug/metabolite transporter (DMT)-like permease n=1 Tax=Martelella mediterranea TaxID=293089 RepID=A0A4R3NS42_9HYPH|nr:DMT family transporter [Martelella mediterranea]TCT38815.1 drug/metabolite transporter (DMT)-like permease [Martelella mediterranea]
MRISPNHLGALFMILAMAGFASNDATVKLLTEEIGVGQIMFFRGIILTGFAMLIAWRAKAISKVGKTLQPRVAARSFCELIAAICYLQALKQMPLANAAAILQCLPLAVTLGAALFMGEPVGWRRWSAIIAGFIGVMIIIQPGPNGFEDGAIYVVVAMLAASTRDLITKTIRSDVPAIVITLSTSALLTLGGAVLGTMERDWEMLTAPILFQLVLAALFLLGGYQFIVFAVRKADISYIAPFRYAGLLWATLLGIIVFATYPGPNVLMGGAIVVAAGLYSFYRERKRGQEPLSETTQPGAAEGGGLIARGEEDLLDHREKS